ncbi:MAG: MBL fold metallo-hydrolase [Candidatus Ancaeobacter aquaticus]|nr:MBL fold metallo-hydrolase [Candidatus Ancaeobacter aquaticus]
MIKKFEVGPLDANCYVLSCDDTKCAAVVDLGGTSKMVSDYIVSNDLTVHYLICTHGHYDHIGGIADFKKKYGKEIPVMIHTNDVDMFVHPKKYVPLLGVLIPGNIPPDKELYDGEAIKIGNMEIKVIHTPGHTPGGVSLYDKNGGYVLTGDTLFHEGVGRTDLAYGSFEDLKCSIEKKLFVLPDETVVYPGHGSHSTIGHEKQHNPYVGE